MLTTFSTTRLGLARACGMKAAGKLAVKSNWPDIIAAKPNLRLLTTGALPDPRSHGIMAKTVSGGLLVQSRDNVMVEDLDLKVVTKRAPTATELEDMKFAFKIAKHVKSNAVIYAKDGQTAGIGAGQMSRIDSARIAAQKAEEAAKIAPAPRASTVGSWG